MAKVEIYLRTTCPFCIRAKRLLDMKKVQAVEYNLDYGGPKFEEMVQRAGGRSTVPQIFIGGQYVGGCDELMMLEYDGKLDALLAA